MFPGRIRDNNTKNKKYKILVDSGCQEVITSRQKDDQWKLPCRKTNLHAELWDGTLVPMEQCSRNLEIQLNHKTPITVRPYVVDWISYDMILGKT